MLVAAIVDSKKARQSYLTAIVSLAAERLAGADFS